MLSRAWCLVLRQTLIVCIWFIFVRATLAIARNRYEVALDLRIFSYRDSRGCRSSARRGMFRLANCHRRFRPQQRACRNGAHLQFSFELRIGRSIFG